MAAATAVRADPVTTTSLPECAPYTTLRNGYWVSRTHDASGRPLSRPEQAALNARVTEARRAATVYQVTDRRRELKENEVPAPSYANARPKRLRDYSALSPDRKWVMFPPFLGADLFGTPVSCADLRDGEDFDGDATPTHGLEPRLRQPEAFEAALADVEERGAALVCLPTGFGKSWLALQLASRWGKKTLVLIHKSDMLRQWSEDGVGALLPGLSVGIVGTVKSKKLRQLDRDVVVCMVQTIALENNQLTEEDLKPFGTVIVDEAHHYGSDKWSKVLPALHCKRFVGLTATPEQALGPILRWWFGGVSFRCQREAGAAVVRPLIWDVPGRQAAYRSDGEIDYTESIKLIASDGARNAAIAQLVARLASSQPAAAPPPPEEEPTMAAAGGAEGGGSRKRRRDDAEPEPSSAPEQQQQQQQEPPPPQEPEEHDRHVLVLTELREHASELHRLLTEAHGVDAGIMMGGSKPEEVAVARDKPVIVSTYSFAGEATNIPHLNTLVMGLPRKTIAQNMGRVMRGICTNASLIFDVVDPFSVFNGQRHKRRQYYAQQGFFIDRARPLLPPPPSQQPPSVNE